MSLLLLCLALCAALLWWLWPQRNSSPLAPQVSSEPDTSKLLFAAQDEELLSFTIHPKGGESYTILREDGTYRLASDPGFPLDGSMIQNMTDAILYLRVSDTLADLKGDRSRLGDYGLDDSALRIEAKLRDGRELRFMIGDRAPFDAPRDYLMMEGDSHLYAIPNDVREALDYRAKLLHTLPAINFAPELLERMRISGPTGVLTLQRIQPGLWEIQEPFRYPADGAAMERLLIQVSSMRMAAYEAEGGGQALREYGLAEPRFEVEMYLPESVITSYPDDGAQPVRTSVAAQTFRFAVGDAIEHIGFYCLYNGVIYRASDLSMGFMLDADADSYLGRQPFDVPLSNVSELDMQFEEKGRRYELSLVEQVLPNNELARDEAGNVLHNYIVKSGGQELDPEPLARAYGLLMEITAKGRLSADYRLIGDPLLSVSLRFTGGRSRQVSFYPYDALNAAAAVNGRFIHYVGLDKLNSAIEAIEGIEAAMMPPPTQTSP